MQTFPPAHTLQHLNGAFLWRPWYTYLLFVLSDFGGRTAWNKTWYQSPEVWSSKVNFGQENVVSSVQHEQMGICTGTHSRIKLMIHCLNCLLPRCLHLTSTHPSEPDLITILISLMRCVGYACCEIIIFSFSDRQNCLWYMGRGFLVNHWIVAEALYWSCSVFSNLCHDIHDIIVKCSGLLHQLMMRNWGSAEIIRLHVTDTLPSLWDTELRSVWVNQVLS